MLRVKVQSCKWECLLCSRSFSTKFCYALHCKNVHGKSHEDSIIDASCIIENRPQEQSKDIENHKDETQNGSTESENIALDGEHISAIEQNGKEEGQSESTMACEVCKKPFSNSERLNSHRTLHTAPSPNRVTRSSAGKALKRKRGGQKRNQARIHEDEGRGESGNDSEQEEQIQEESQLEENQSGDRKDHNKTNDHFHASSIMESTDSENKAPVTTQGDSSRKMQSATEGKEESENNSQFMENIIVNTEDANIPISVTHPRKRGRPRKDQKPIVTTPKTRSSSSDDTNIEQNIVFPCPKSDEKEVKKSGPRKKTRECDICNKVFANRSSLREHRRIHTGEKPFICAVCDKGFIRMGHLKQHMCSHTGLWPFKCGACGKGFMNPSRVTRHMRVHNDERPNVCDQCGESFKEPHHLARHMHLHSGVKPYKCPICEDRYFIQSGNLKIHMKTHEGEITDSSVSLDEISHEIVASTSKTIPDENTSNSTTQEQEAALEGIITVSEGDIKTIDSNEKNTDLNTESGNSTDVNESSKSEDVPTVSEIVLQIVPGTEHNVQVHGLQGLASIDQELLRQFASSVAQELAQSGQGT